MTGGTAAAIVVGFFGLVSGMYAARLSYKASKRTARADEIAAAFDAYDDLLRNYVAEIARLTEKLGTMQRDADESAERFRVRLNTATEEIATAENRCRECRAEVADLLADLAALRSIVIDEVAKSAAGESIALHSGPEDMNDGERAELDAIRRFLGRLSPSNEEDQ